MDEYPNFSVPQQETPRKKGRWQFFLKLTIGVGLTAFILSLIDFREVIEILGRLNPWFLLVVVFVFYLERAVTAYKWDVLLREVDVRVPFSLLFQVYTTVPIVGTIIPSTIGGDIYRFVSISRHNGNGQAVLASMVIDRVIATAITLFLALVSLGLAFYWMRGSWASFAGVRWTIAIGVTIVLAALGVLFLSFKLGSNRLIERLSHFSVARKLIQVYNLSAGYLKDLRILSRVSVLTILVQTVPVLKNLLIARGLGIDVSLLEMMIVVPIIILAIRLPISIDSFGVQEGLYVALFGLVGVSASEAFLMSTMARVVELLSALPWGIHYLLRDRQKIMPVNRSSPEEKGGVLD